MVINKRKNLKSLAAGRPPTARLTKSMSRKASRTLINKHHQLEKKRLQAKVIGDHHAETRAIEEIDRLGGLRQYQKASLQGQSTDRGGDTSKVLMEWLPVEDLKSRASTRLTMLEVGSLSTRNACSMSGIFDVTHIDLNSQENGILKQDFMKRPLPGDNGDRFDIISLSLVLNFVPDASQRGEMLLHTLRFLRLPSDTLCSREPHELRIFPCLFIVLPRSCVDNSRYLTIVRFGQLMSNLGYVNVKAKVTQKLFYSLWRLHHYDGKHARFDFPKKQVNPGRTRNNFVITLKESN